MRSQLRARVLVSHLLPLLIALPLAGLALVYILQVHVLLPDLSQQLRAQAELAAAAASEHPEVWTDRARAAALLERWNPRGNLRLTLYVPTGEVWGASGPDQYSAVGTARLKAALAGEPFRGPVQDAGRSGVLEALEPVRDPVPSSGAAAVRGVVGVTLPLAQVQPQVDELAYVIAAILAASLIFGTALALLRARTMEQPLEQLAGGLEQLAVGHEARAVPEEGAGEFRPLLAAFNRVARRLQAAEDSRRQLVANLGHELGTALGAMHSGLQALRAGADQDPELRRELLAGLDDKVGELRRLTADLDQWATQFEGTFELQRRPTDLAQWLPPVLAPWREAARQKGLAWETRVADDLPVLELDPERLAQVLGNLIANAIKYTRTGGITIEANRTTDEVWLRVMDTGIGIAPEARAHIFEPFYRGPRARLVPEGVGLGLTIARELVAAHGGRLDLTGSPETGSAFTIRLPLVPATDTKPVLQGL